MIFARLQNTEDELFDKRLTPVLRLLPWQLKKMENEGPSKKEVGGGGGWGRAREKQTKSTG